MGESKIVKCSSPSIHASLFEDAQGRRTLITLNALNQPAKGVRLEIVNLANGTVRTRFEAGRTLPAQNGGFSDDFDSLQRHVYDLPVRSGGDPVRMEAANASLAVCGREELPPRDSCRHRNRKWPKNFS